MITLILKKNGKVIKQFQVYEETSIKEEMRILEGFQNLSYHHSWQGKEKTNPKTTTKIMEEKQHTPKINSKRAENKIKGGRKWEK